MTKKKYSFVFMGVSGSGKSAVAESVAEKIGVPFLDGDFLHPRRNIEKMASGTPLDDDDRAPWLESINSAIYAMQRTHDTSILVCSALKRKYRDILRKENIGVYFIYLKGNFDLIAERMKSRQGHFFKTEMLKSQFEVLEEPLNNHNDIYVIDISFPLDIVINNCVKQIQEIQNAV